METQKAALIYVGDPMCSWCWGIAPEITQLKEKYADKIGFKMIMGGLRPSTTEPMDAKMKEYLFHHWEEVHQRTGQPFNYRLLEREDFVYNTEAAARAVVTMRKLKPEVAFDFFKAIQYTFYAKNHDPNHITTYLSLLPYFEVDAEKFVQKFESKTLKKLTKEEFKLAADFNVRSFPTVLLHLNGRLGSIAKGYQTFAQMDQKVQMMLQQSLAN